MMEIDDNLIGLEVLILSKELSAEEYFTIVVSTCENDLKIAKSAVANVLKKIKPNDVTYQKLKTLYNEFFQEEFCFEENSSESNTDLKNKPASVSNNTKSKKKRIKRKILMKNHYRLFYGFEEI